MKLMEYSTKIQKSYKEREWNESSCSPFFYKLTVFLLVRNVSWSVNKFKNTLEWNNVINYPKRILRNSAFLMDISKLSTKLELIQDGSCSSEICEMCSPYRSQPSGWRVSWCTRLSGLTMWSCCWWCFGR